MKLRSRIILFIPILGLAIYLWSTIIQLAIFNHHGMTWIQALGGFMFFPGSILVGAYCILGFFGKILWYTTLVALGKDPDRKATDDGE
jgi:hypothetical protein